MYALATEMKDKIEAFKNERIGSKRKDFVETVQTEEPKGDEVLDTVDVVAETAETAEPMDTTEG